MKRTIRSNTEDITNIVQKAKQQSENQSVPLQVSFSNASKQYLPGMFKKVDQVLPDEDVEEMPLETIENSSSRRNVKKFKALKPILEEEDQTYQKQVALDC